MHSPRRLNIAGQKVRQIRKEQKITQADVAARCSVLGFRIGESTISQIECGRRRLTDIELAYLAKALRVPVNILFPQ